MKRILAVVACTMLGGGVAAARDVVANGRPTPPPPPKCDPAKDRNHCEKTINIDKALGIDGKLRQLSMLQFLERATEELERSALEKKSFVPKLVQSVEEEAL
jgi:hypothetical protein